MNAITPLIPYFFKYGYGALFVIVYLSAVYLPLPSNLALIGAGILSHIPQQGVHFSIFIAAVIALSANVLGDVTGYYIARRFQNEARQKKFEEKHESYNKITRYLESHPITTVGVSRLIGFASPWVNTISGFTKIPIQTFLIGDILGNAFCISVYMGMGYLLGNSHSHLYSLIGLGIGASVFVIALYSSIYILFIRDPKK